MTSDYAPSELAAMIDRMRAVSAAFYRGAVQTNVHGFVEFCGLMNKYIDVCERARLDGIDFTAATVHGEVDLPVERHDIAYLAEKFACIFAPMMFANPEMWGAFKAAVDRELRRAA